MLRHRRHFLASGLAASAFACGAGIAAPAVTVFAAASLKAVLDDVLMRFNGNIRVAYGGSGALARQIVLGAPAEMFLSAHRGWMDEVEAAGRITTNTRVDLLGNSLVLVTQRGAEDVSLDALPEDAKIAMGFLEAVPAGQYGRMAFESLGLWQHYKTQVVQTDTVQAALTLVVRGEVPFGVVYATDAMAEPNVQVAAQFPAQSHLAIRYPLALLKGHSTGARFFYDHLRGAEAASIFTKYGFKVL